MAKQTETHEVRGLQGKLFGAFPSKRAARACANRILDSGRRNAVAIVSPKRRGLR